MITEDKIIEIKNLAEFIGPEMPEIPVTIYGGEKVGIIGMSGQSNQILIKLILGFEIAGTERVIINGEDMAGFSPEKVMEHRRNTGVIFEDAQLVSNLKVIENVQLPLWYHTRRPAYDIMEQSISFLESVGYTDDIWKQPGSLSMYERKIVNLARILAMNPSIVIYDKLYKGLTTSQAIQVSGYTNRFHDDAPARVSIFTASSEEDINEFNVDRVITIKQADI